ncbi:MAG: PEGA domain-containing protein [Bacteroidaceae bacterium]|nr:PEGA domain-containing protein [Bacteroidaceae bacterium]
MKKSFIVVVAILCSLFALSNEAHAKRIKIVTNPEFAKIYVDGNYVGDGVYFLKFTRKDDFFNIKVEAPGYVEKTMRVYKHDSRKTIPIDLREDESIEASVESHLANKYFTINVRDGVDESTAWKLLTQVMLNYFDEMKTSDKSSGFMNTAWEIDKFPESDVKIRTMVQIKEITNDGMAYQIRISSEKAPLDARGEHGFVPWERILKKYEPLINEMQQRIGKN